MQINSKLNECYIWTALPSANQNRVLFSCVLLACKLRGNPWVDIVWVASRVASRVAMFAFRLSGKICLRPAITRLWLSTSCNYCWRRLMYSYIKSEARMCVYVLGFLSFQNVKSLVGFLFFQKQPFSLSLWTEWKFHSPKQASDPRFALAQQASHSHWRVGER